MDQASLDSLSREECFQNLLDDNEISDVVLVGSDDVRVFAVRALLASRSTVFRRMLYGDFLEGSKREIRIGYKGWIIRAIVQYIYTDKEPKEHTLSFTSRIDGLLDATIFFELGTLRQKLVSVACRLMEKDASNAMEFFCHCQATDIKKMALSKILSDPEMILKSKSFLSIDSSKLEAILKEQTIQATEITLFKILQAWSKGQSDALNGIPDEETSVKRRGEIASKLTRLLALERIHPEELCKTVSSSGLVTQEQLYQAFKIQALQAAKKEGRSYAKPRAPLWTSSNDVVFRCTTETHSVEFLKCAVLRYGVHKWSIKVEKMCNTAWLGVASTEHPVDKSRWLGCQDRVGWVYGANGAACCNETGSEGPYDKIHTEFDEGSIVTLTLDITLQGGGTLSASLDGKPSFQLFTNMLSKFEGLEEVGFQPAVSLCQPGKVKFLGFGYSAVRMA